MGRFDPVPGVGTTGGSAASCAASAEGAELGPWGIAVVPLGVSTGPVGLGFGPWLRLFVNLLFRVPAAPDAACAPGSTSWGCWDCWEAEAVVLAMAAAAARRRVVKLSSSMAAAQTAQHTRVQRTQCR